MAEHRNTTVTVRMVLKACAAAGVDTDELLNAASIDRKTAEDPDGEVSFEQMRNFWQAAFRLSDDPQLAIHAAEQVEVGDYKCIDYLVINASTIGQSLENFCRYMVLVNTWIAWEIIKDKESVTLQMLSAAGTIPPLSYEFVFSFYTRRMRMLTDNNWAPALIRFPFPAPADPQVHRDFFKTEVQYNAATGEFIVSMDRWKEAIPSSDEQLFKLLDEHARMLLSQRTLPDDFVGKIKQEIVRDLHGGEASRDTIASRLGLSPRTMQRRLDENGISFAELLDEVRAELAKNKLQGSDLSLAEIGFLLGFSEQSSFTRAFKRWIGQTPREYRLGLSTT